MVLGLVLMGAAIPTVFATTEAVRSNQQQSREQARSRPFRITASCSPRALHREEVDEKLLALRDGKVYLVQDSIINGPKTLGHPLLSHYRSFPTMNYLGLVSTIQDEPPILSWIYVDKHTLEVKCGSRADAIDHITGPFDWTQDRGAVTLDGWEGFVAVEEKDGVWAVYFDVDDDGKRLPEGKKVVEISLVRRKYTRGKAA